MVAKCIVYVHITAKLKAYWLTCLFIHIKCCRINSLHSWYSLRQNRITLIDLFKMLPKIYNGSAWICLILGLNGQIM